MRNTLFSCILPGQYFTIDPTYPSSLVAKLGSLSSLRLLRKVSYARFIEVPDGLEDEILREVDRDFYVIPVNEPAEFRRDLTPAN